MLFTHAIYAWRLEHLWNVVLLILFWSIPNNLGLLGLDPQFICTLGWAFPIMGDPRCGYWCHFGSSSVTLTPNHLDLSLAEKAAKQPSPLPEIWIGFPSPWDVFFLTALMSRFSKFSNPFFLSLLPYLYPPLSVVIIMR